jgi:prephenate dehydratase/chorismate mutase/prephenate dehydratase
MNLKDLRKQIDFLDASIIKLLNERMEKAIMAKKFKTSVEDQEREREVLAKIERNSRGLVDGEFCVRLYKEIMAESKRLQEKDLKTIGFQGEHGANSEIAAKAWDKTVVAIPCAEFSDVLHRVDTGMVDYGILPVENTLGGIVGPVNNLLIYTKLHVIYAVDLKVSHCLVAAPGTDYREIKDVYSHPQALFQCRNFLSRNKLEPIPYPDTAGAGKMLIEKRPKGSAAIASRLAAEIYGLEIIKEDIQDLDNNRTRFFVLSPKPNEAGGAKCSIVFTTGNKAGDLFGVLEIFAKAGINLTRIESVPFEPGNYAIFVDLVGSDRDPKVVEALGRVAERTGSYRLLGCYDEVST